MKVNESALDRGIRTVIGLALLALGFSGMAAGTLGIVLIVLGSVLLLTGLIGFCPLYALFKLQTNH